MRFLIFFVLYFLVACHEETANDKDTATTAAPVESVPATTSEAYISIDLKELQQVAFPEPAVVEVSYDHSRKKSKRYEAYPFQPVWDYLIDKYDLDPAGTQIVFECKDGYLAPNQLREVYEAGGGYLAFRDLDAPEGKNWPADMEAKYAPYYLVWKDVPADDHHLAWPYGLVKIRLFKNDPYASLLPRDRPDLAEAFVNYKLHCIKCHSINKIGGEMGPEFNYPKNITEYWSRED
ncbi:MAG: hypothetical protein AAFP02_17870, partial [Bacteroidota bacterium]